MRLSCTASGVFLHAAGAAAWGFSGVWAKGVAAGLLCVSAASMQVLAGGSGGDSMGESTAASPGSAMARWSLKLGESVSKAVDDGAGLGPQTSAGDEEASGALPHGSFGPGRRGARGAGLLRHQLGARSVGDVDIYMTRAKVPLNGPHGRSVLLSLGASMTKASPFGLAGFTGPYKDQQRLQLEGGAGMLVREDLVVGAGFRLQPNGSQMLPSSLGLQEEEAWDFFVAWRPWRHVSLATGWLSVDDGSPKRARSGLYLSGRFSY